MNSSKLKQYLGILVALAVIGLLVYFLSQDITRFAPILDVSLGAIITLLVVALAYALAQGALYNSVLKYFSINLGQVESFGALMLTLFGNYFFPFAGFGVRGVYLNRAYGLGARDYTMSVIAIVLVELTVYAGLGLLATILLFGTTRLEVLPIILFFSGVVAGGVFAILFKVPFIDRIPALNAINKLLIDWYTIREKPGFRLRLIFFTLLQYTLYTSLFAAGFVALTADFSILELMVQSALSDFGFVFKIAPAGLGTYEALVVFVNSLVGKEASLAIMLLLLIRFGMLFWPLVLTPFFVPLFTRKAKVTGFKELFAGSQ